jgi:hypothetical protein
METTMEVQKINLLTSDSNHYLLREKQVSVKDGIINGTATITGYHFGKLNPGDILKIYDDYTIVEVSQRDHKGRFRDESKRKNSFFEAKCTFSRRVKN